MIRNYLLIAFRNIWRNKGFSTINILGLAIGITTCVIMLLFVQNELSYDRFNKKASQMVRIVFRGQVKGEEMREASVFPPVAQTLKREYPEVEEATRLSMGGSQMVSYNGKTFKENSVAFADSNFFDVFTIPLLEGNTKTVLRDPYTIVISKAFAKKYFGDQNPVGKIITFKDAAQGFQVTGMFDKVPDNSHFHFDMFVSMSTQPDSRSDSWLSSNYYTYLVLKEGTNVQQLESKLPAMMDKYMSAQMQKAMGMTFSEFQKTGNHIGLYLQPLTDIHLHSDFTNDMEAPGDIRYVYIFSAIAIFMLLIACINFMNLSTASASKRAREVGIRKVMGSLKGNLVAQFLLESFLLTAIALMTAVVLVQIALPIFNELSGKELKLEWFNHPWLIPGLLVIGIITGLLAGTYPAFFLSSFKPVKVLKGDAKSPGKSMTLRSGLVVFQFFISITLMVSTVVVYKQLSFIQNKKLGYDKEQVLVLPETWLLGQKELVFKEELSKDPRIASITYSPYLPAGPSWGNNFFIYEKTFAEGIKALRYDVDPNYISTLGMKLKAGRNFSEDLKTDSNAAILNESAVAALGWKDNYLGKQFMHSDNGGTQRTYRVIGLVEDFHFKSMHEKISPLVMTLSPSYGMAIMKTRTKDVSELLASIKSTWNKLNADAPFSYVFLDESFNKTFRAEQNTGRTLAIFAGLTIFVACLGLFGLATFTARQRSKEISIRKVLGASVTNVVALLSRDFLKLVIIAFIIAAPIAWYVMDLWLQDFAYRINISWWVFALAAFAAIVFTLLTVSVQAIRAALTNPVNILRNE